MERRQCPSCGKYWYSSEGQAIWECECGAEMAKEDEVEMEGGTQMIHVQIIDNGAVHEAEKEFPNLFKEVWNQDMYSSSSWYELSEGAYAEWLEFTRLKRLKKKEDSKCQI